MKRMMFLVTMLVGVYASYAMGAEPNWPANDNCAGILQIGAFEPKLAGRTITVEIQPADEQKCIAEWKVGVGIRVYDPANKHWLEIASSYRLVKSDRGLHISFDLPGQYLYYRIRMCGENSSTTNKSNRWLFILNTPYTRVDMNNNPAYEFMVDTGKSAITQVPAHYGPWSW